MYALMEKQINIFPQMIVHISREKVVLTETDLG